MGKLTNMDWWLGRTPEQQQSKADAREEFHEGMEHADEVAGRIKAVGENVENAGWKMTGWLTIPIVAVLAFVLFGFVGLAVAAVLFLLVRWGGKRSDARIDKRDRKEDDDAG